MFHEKLDIKLIRLVKQHNVLYDYNNDKYMDFNSREVAWQMIGDELKRPAGDCKVRWINIRDVHRRILRKSLNGTSATKPYKYESELLFMRKFYKDVSAPMLSGDDNEKADEWSITVCDEIVEGDSGSEDTYKPVVKAKAKLRKPKKVKEQYEEHEKQASSTVNETAVASSDFDAADPVDAFLLSIGSTLKTFSAYHLNVAKSKIFSIVQEHDLQQIVQSENHEQPDVKTSANW